MRPAMKQYRRHLKACPHRHKKDWTRCHCPLWCDGMLNGERYRRSLKTNSWDKGIKKLAALDSAQFGEEKGIREAISAWDTTLVLRRLKPATLRKYRRLAKQLQKWCEKNACMIVGQLTAETIDQFRLSRAHVASLGSQPVPARGAITLCEAKSSPPSIDIPAFEEVTPTPIENTDHPYDCGCELCAAEGNWQHWLDLLEAERGVL